MTKSKTNRYKAKTRIFSKSQNRFFEAGEVIEYATDLAKALKPLIDKGILEPVIDTENDNATQG